MTEYEACALPNAGCGRNGNDLSPTNKYHPVTTVQHPDPGKNNTVQTIAPSGCAPQRTSLLYYIRFDYFNTIKHQWCSLPEGLELQAFYGNIPCQTVTSVKHGLYEVRIVTDQPYNHTIPLRLTFEAPNRWIYTKDSDAVPRFVDNYHDVDETLPKSTITRQDLALKPFTFTSHFYDLPEKWDSENWVCTLGSKQGRAQQLLTESTTAVVPLTFCLDDIVLTDRSLHQGITDQNAIPDTTGGPHEFDLRKVRGTAKSLSNTSRARFLCFSKKNRQLQVYSTTPEGSPQQRYDGSIIRFARSSNDTYRNYFHRPPEHVRAVLFCGEIYDVTLWRTKSTEGDHFCSEHVCGARAAVRNDRGVHYGKTVTFNTAAETINCSRIGKHDMHYLHDCGVVDGITYGTLVIYWSAFFLKNDTMSEESKTALEGLSASVDEYQPTIMENIMEHWNGKAYQFIDTAGRNDLIIHPLFIFETNETLHETHGGGIDETDSADRTVPAAMTGFKKALERCSGGVPMSISFVKSQGNGTPPSIQYIEFGASSAGIVSGNTDGISTDTATNTEFHPDYDSFVLAYQLNQVKRQIDSIKTSVRMNHRSGRSRFPFFWLKNFYKKDKRSGIDTPPLHGNSIPNAVFSRSTPPDNGHSNPVRLRDLWYFVKWLNDNCARTDTIGRFLKGQQFTVVSHHCEKGVARKLYYYQYNDFKRNPWSFMEHSNHPETVKRPENISVSTAIMTGLRSCTERVHISKLRLTQFLKS